MKSIALTCLLLLASAPALIAQTQSKEAGAATANPIVSTVRQMEQRFAKNLSGAADEMPADKYSYKPTPDQMTFGHLMMHVAEANYAFCAAAGGEQPKEMKMSETDSKEALSKAVKDSFAYCEQVLAKADDSTLGQSVTLFGKPATRGAALIRLATNWGDHYSAAAMYLRLNNLLPPSAEKSSGK
jgi:uncharacterized damage-inducible protein DinB